MNPVPLTIRRHPPLVGDPRLRHVAERLVVPATYVGLMATIYFAFATAAHIVAALVASPDVDAAIEPFVMVGIVAMAAALIALIGLVGSRIAGGVR